MTRSSIVTTRHVDIFSHEISTDPLISDQDKDIHERYERFRHSIFVFSNHDNDVISMQNLDLVFFPIVDDRFFYMVVFNLRNPEVLVIDSHDRVGAVDELYEYKTYGLHDVMVMHLKKEGHPAWKAYSEIDQEQVKIKWQMKQNMVDGGVMLMRMMETFMGYDSHKWENGLYKEGTKQKKQLKDLRSKYVSKILLSDVNIRKLSIVNEIPKFIAMEATLSVKKKLGRQRIRTAKV